MKTLLMLVTLMSLSTVQANDIVELSAKCFESASETFEYQGPRSSDRRKSVGEVAKYLKEGQELLNLHKYPIAVMDEDSLIYRGTGSEYSGWFEYAIVVNPKTCKVTAMLETYGE